MGFLIAAIVIAVFALALLIIGAALEKSGRSFRENQRKGLAEVVGYERAEQSNWYTLLVRIPALNDGKIYNCTAGKIHLSQYPKGSVIRVLYAPKRIAGMNVVEVHLLDDPPADSSRLGRGIKRVSIIMLVAAGVIAVAGLAALL